MFHTLYREIKIYKAWNWCFNEFLQVTVLLKKPKAGVETEDHTGALLVGWLPLASFTTCLG